MNHTGDAPPGLAAVDDALASLEGLQERPVEEHPAVFESVHRALRAVLNDDQGA